MEKSNLASILQRKKNKNLTLAHRQLWGMIDLVYKDFYDKESKIYDAGNVTREEFSIIKHVYKTRHVVNYTEIKALLNNKHLSHVGWVIKNLEKKRFSYHCKTLERSTISGCYANKERNSYLRTHIINA